MNRLRPTSVYSAGGAHPQASIATEGELACGRHAHLHLAIWVSLHVPIDMREQISFAILFEVETYARGEVVHKRCSLRLVRVSEQVENKTESAT